MSEHPFMFGVTPCLVRVQAGNPETARAYVICDGGRALQPVADRAATPVEFAMGGEAADFRDALGHAVGYLAKRFGKMGSLGREWDAATFSACQILDDPLRDERPKLGEKQPGCRATQGCKGPMEWKNVRVPDAVFGDAFPEPIPDYEAWVCDTCGAECRFSN